MGEVAQLLRDRAIYVEQTAQAFADAIDRAVSEPQPDVEYDLRDQTWAARTSELLKLLNT